MGTASQDGMAKNAGMHGPTKQIIPGRMNQGTKKTGMPSAPEEYERITGTQHGSDTNLRGTPQWQK